jgi:hypothetical protein
MANSQSGGYRVVYPGVVREQLKSWVGKVKELGILSDYQAALKTINQNLANDPLGWGERSFTFPDATLIVCKAASQFLIVYYGVDEAKKIVYVAKIKPFPSHPLATDS